ncbi:MAG: type II toxin-antitoxin system HicB family antitoxin [Pseudomonadota bacterium]
MNTMTHKGYIARVAYSDEDALFTGRIAGIDDVIGFHGESVAELKAAFIEAVEDYLTACQKIGRKPQKTYSGRFIVRVEPDIHARAVVAAQAEGKSLNLWVSEAITARQAAL